MRKQKLTARAPIIPDPAITFSGDAVDVCNLVVSIDRFLRENYRAAYRLQTEGDLCGTLAVIPTDLAKILALFFRLPVGGTALNLSLSVAENEFRLVVAFDKSVGIAPDVQIEILRLAGANGFSAHGDVRDDMMIVTMTAPLASDALLVRALDGADFYSVLLGVFYS